MSADDFALTTADTRALGEHLLSISQRHQPIFWIALVLAALVHVMAIVGIGVSQPRRVGDPNGAADAIDVEIIDEAALHKKMGLPSAAESMTANPPSPATPPPAEQPKAETEPEPEPVPEPKKEETPPKEEKPAEAVPEQETAKAVPALPAEKAQPELPAPPPEKQDKADKEAKKSEPKPAPKATAEAKPKPKPKPKTPKQLDLSVPLNIAGEESSGGDPSRHSGVSRPPGITRSGENDRFGRDVIRALKRTMPPPMGIMGRVTIKIVLNQRGNVASVKLVQSGGNRSLDGEVLFAAGQTSYPFPPKGATEADRTFLVTYIYR